MVTRLQRAGLPHSEIIGSKPVCSYPMLIAAYHVLLRLQKPRHPPSALVTFVSVSIDTFESQELPCLHLFSCFVCLWNCSPQLDSDFSRSPDSLFFRYRLSFSIFYLVISLNLFKELSVFISNGLQRYGLFLNLQIFLEYFFEKIDFLSKFRDNSYFCPPYR